jgi:tripartite ATP-independent transporter DctP family solute receptor
LLIAENFVKRRIEEIYVETKENNIMPVLSRRLLLGGATALPLVTIQTQRADAAPVFRYRLGTNLAPTHPLNVTLSKAIANIKARTDGRMQIMLFPNSALGSDTNMLSQIRTGAVQFFTLSGLILSTLVPEAALSGVGYAFKNYDQVWSAMDGKVGAYIRSRIADHGLTAFDNIFDNGFREVTTSTKPILTPADLEGLKIRVPFAALWTSLFKDFGAVPTSINFNEVYSALQTHLADAQENPLAIIETSKMYQVQKYCSLTNHMWDGFWFLANPAAFEKLPAKIQAIVQEEINHAALAERKSVSTLTASLQGKLAGQGMKFNKTDPQQFRDVLIKAGFYTEWQKHFGPQAWSLLEGAVGKLG